MLTTLGELTVNDSGKNPDGSIAIREWIIQPSGKQVERHLPMFGTDIAQKMSRGDRDMIRDIIHENRKQEKGEE